MKQIIILFLFAIILSSCGAKDVNVEGYRSFFGDSVAVFVVKNLQNGYQVSFIHNKDLTMAHFKRGDSISSYCSLENLPLCLNEYMNEGVGEVMVDINIPVVKLDTLGGSKTPEEEMFFMDVNFDGEEDLIQSCLGNGKILYYCYDIVNGACGEINSGVICAMREEPFCRFVSAPLEHGGDYVAFNYEKKEIFILTTSGCCAYYNTWAKYFEGDSLGNPPRVKAIKQEAHVFDGETETIETSLMQNDYLQLVDITKRKY